MKIRAVFLDFGGVIVRTEDREPRTRLAARFHMTCRELEKLVFESDSSRRASLGEITEDAHWSCVVRELRIEAGEKEDIVQQFFAGDRIDRLLLGYVCNLRPSISVGLISNAWSGLREWIVEQGIAEVFDHIAISAELGVMKPDQRIYRMALESLAVRPEEAIFVDDTPANVEAAQVLGMHGIVFQKPEQVLDVIRKIVEENNG